MSEGWAEVTLGDVYDIQIGPAFKSSVFREATHGPRLLRGMNLGPAGTRWDETFLWPDSQLNGFERFLLQAGDVCIAMDATFTSQGEIRAAEIAESDLPALLVQRVARLRPEPESAAHPKFLSLLVRSDVFRDHLSDRQTGAFAPHISGKDIASFEFRLPPLPVQRRIVDLMAHLDNHLANLRAEREVAVDVLSQAAVERVRLPGDSGTPISDLLLRNIGGVWGESAGTGDQTVDAFRSTEFTDLGYLSGPADARRDVSPGQLASRELAAGDVLVEKSGGTPTRSVGRVVRLTTGDLLGPSVGANFLQLLRTNPDLADPGYVFWILWAAHRRGDGFGFQQASTNIRNLKTKEYLGRRVDLPSRQDQAEVGAELDSILLLIRGIDLEINVLTSLRGQLLSNLLSGGVEIPEAYDLLLPEPA